MHNLLFLLAVLLLAACGGNVRQAEVAHLDFGNFTLAWRPATLPLRGVGVFAPSWLGSTAMQYRLLYADPMQRENYGESRWAAPPAELIERALNRQVATTAGGCRLRLELDDLTQVFDTPRSSRSLLDVRASLIAPKRDAVLARKAFALARPAPSADARGGASAAATAVQALAGELGKWLDQAAQDDPALARRCREN